MMHCITLLLSWANLITCARHSGNSVSKFNNCCMYHVYWVAFILVNLCWVTFLLVCVYIVAGGWLSVAITIIAA